MDVAVICEISREETKMNKYYVVAYKEVNFGDDLLMDTLFCRYPEAEFVMTAPGDVYKRQPLCYAVAAETFWKKVHMHHSRAGP